MTRLQHWRKKIDQIDRQLVDLLNERSRYAIEIGRIKGRESLQIYDPVREKAVIRNAQDSTRGPLSKEAVGRLFESIIDETRRAERKCLDLDRLEDSSSSSEE